MRSGPLRVTLQYSADCPNWTATHERVLQALAELGRPDAVLELQAVATPQEAEAVGFRGSPTVLVDGVDPFAEPSDPVGLCCRVYETPGGLAGGPTLPQLLAALRAVC